MLRILPQRGVALKVIGDRLGQSAVNVDEALRLPTVGEPTRGGRSAVRGSWRCKPGYQGPVVGRAVGLAGEGGIEGVPGEGTCVPETCLVPGLAGLGLRQERPSSLFLW